MHLKYVFRLIPLVLGKMKTFSHFASFTHILKYCALDLHSSRISAYIIKKGYLFYNDLLNSIQCCFEFGFHSFFWWSRKSVIRGPGIVYLACYFYEVLLLLLYSISSHIMGHIFALAIISNLPARISKA